MGLRERALPSVAVRLTALAGAAMMLLACAHSVTVEEEVSEPVAAAVPPSEPTAVPTPVPEAPTPEPAAVPASPTPRPTPAPTVTATPAPTPRVIRARAETESRPAPDFQVETFDGQTLRLSDLVGSVVVLNFWASWCPPCRWEMPSFETIWQEYREDDVVFVGIAMSDTFEEASEFAQTVGVTYPLALDETNEIVREYGVFSLPTTFFIDVEGRVQRRLTSAANEGLLKVFIRGQLASKSRTDN